MIVVVDYEMGNLRSVEKALEYMGAEVTVTSRREAIVSADKVVLPGVGAYPQGMKNLKKLGLVDLLRHEVLEKRKPFLGICLGMQLLARKSYEFEETEGLGWIDAEITKLDAPRSGLRLPHVGWNEIQVTQSNPFLSGGKKNTFYFVHSYFMENGDPSDVIAVCDYGQPFTAAIKRGNIFATQFHPEKSQSNGLSILKKFIQWDGN